MINSHKKLICTLFKYQTLFNLLLSIFHCNGLMIIYKKYNIKFYLQNHLVLLLVSEFNLS